MAAPKKKKAPVAQRSGGTLMGMRSGFKTIAGTQKRGRRSSKPWSFQQVLTLVVAVTLGIALIYSLSR